MNQMIQSFIIPSSRAFPVLVSRLSPLLRYCRGSHPEPQLTQLITETVFTNVSRLLYILIDNEAVSPAVFVNGSSFNTLYFNDIHSVQLIVLEYPTLNSSADIFVQAENCYAIVSSK